MRLKIVFICFALFLILLPIIDPGTHDDRSIAFLIWVVISLFGLGVVLVIVQRKSRDSFLNRESWNNARELIDRALDGDIDEEFTANKKFVESGLTKEEFTKKYFEDN